MTGSFPAVAARAANGHVTAAPPNTVMNSRRLIYPDPRKRRIAATSAKAENRLR
jgi:hypothetical protein